MSGAPAPHDLPRVTLAAIRLVNGTLALFAPKMLMTRLGVDVRTSPAVVYGMRMFGVRTLLIGVDMLSSDTDVRERAVRAAPVIHGSDTISAAIAGMRGDLPRRSALTATALSAVNLVLAVMARKAQRVTRP